MLLNLSNHPSSTWPPEQIKAAEEQYEQIKDINFPEIDPALEPDEIFALACEYEVKCLEILRNAPEYEFHTVHIMGELTFCYTLVHLLQAEDVVCIASTTTRKNQTLPDGQPKVHFNFQRFREYPNLAPKKWRAP